MVISEAIKKCIEENAKYFEPRDGIKPIAKLVTLNGIKCWLAKSDAHWFFYGYPGEDLERAVKDEP